MRDRDDFLRTATFELSKASETRLSLGFDDLPKAYDENATVITPFVISLASFWSRWCTVPSKNTLMTSALRELLIRTPERAHGIPAAPREHRNQDGLQTNPPASTIPPRPYSRTSLAPPLIKNQYDDTTNQPAGVISSNASLTPSALLPSLEEDIRALDGCPRLRSSGTTYRRVSRADVANRLPSTGQQATQQPLTPPPISKGGASTWNPPNLPPRVRNPTMNPCTQRVQDILGKANMGDIKEIFKEIASMLKGLEAGGYIALNLAVHAASLASKPVGYFKCHKAQF
ncbi:hypothetical protein CROQUDRAFT_87296 [Cronartium quercuum f. sp. fusiforme G11]|uniref:Uncharacterized protein n=1 Tax=Cronartium quercuum f. sp. fusiforme G11 TaxID=708437 RepID=A0A9P6NWR5_9BASI|nr:hypothetical protein CROQUDRAFT_87296 [Cronartium quercuum f. sp. fusiforme G11]